MAMRPWCPMRPWHNIEIAIAVKSYQLQWIGAKAKVAEIEEKYGPIEKELKRKLTLELMGKAMLGKIEEREKKERNREVEILEEE